MRKGKKEVVIIMKIFMSKVLILFLFLLFLGFGDDENMVVENICLDWVFEGLEFVICVKICICFKDFEVGKGFFFNWLVIELLWFMIVSMCLIKFRKM